MLELFDEGAVVIDIEKDGTRSSALRQVERSAVATEPREDVGHLRPEARYRDKFTSHRGEAYI